ncbi:MAG: hypothetical protein HOW97_01605 [Catenulispora sp.]|nr:hypothetical protein [Catenulispora sp.]
MTTPKNQTLMWEARCDPGKGTALEEWLRTTIIPTLWQDEQVASYNAYTSKAPDADRLVIVIDYLTTAPTTLPTEPPPHLLARPAHTWVFQRLDM